MWRASRRWSPKRGRQLKAEKHDTQDHATAATGRPKQSGDSALLLHHGVLQASQIVEELGAGKHAMAQTIADAIFDRIIHDAHRSASTFHSKSTSTFGGQFVRNFHKINQLQENNKIFNHCTNPITVNAHSSCYDRLRCYVRGGVKSFLLKDSNHDEALNRI